jgi:hypothetical protein
MPRNQHTVVTPPAGIADHRGEERDEHGPRSEAARVVHERGEAGEDRERRQEVADELGGRRPVLEAMLVDAHRVLDTRAVSVAVRRGRRSGEPCGPRRRSRAGARGPRRPGPASPPSTLPWKFPGSAAGGSFTDHQMT